MAGSPADPIHVKVHARVLHRIDARLFGQFMEKASWGSEIGSETAVIPGTHELRPEAKELIRQMQIPIVRFPGGTDADYIDWLDMIDHVPGRIGDRPLTKGHTGNQVTNHFGYDEFLRLCEDLKMEPLLVVNFRDGLLAQDGVGRPARHAAQLAAYCNAPSKPTCRRTSPPGRACARERPSPAVRREVLPNRQRDLGFREQGH